MNSVALVGTVGHYGPKITYTPAGKPQLSFTLEIADEKFRLFVPVLIVGNNAESCAERLEPGMPIALSGKLSWRASKTKEAGSLAVVAYGVDILSTLTAQVAPGSTISP